MTKGDMHPTTLDHSSEKLLRLAAVARGLSHDVSDAFDDLQGIANLLTDWYLVKTGYRLVDLDGREYKIFQEEQK